MRNLILIQLLFLLPIVSFGQNNKVWQDSIHAQATEFFKSVGEIEIIQLEPYCQIKKYPIGIFGRMKKRKVCYESSIIIDSHDDNLPNQIDSTHIKNRYVLDKGKYNYLFDLLFNSEPSNSRAACYNPRHGIIFYDYNRLLIGYLEICFECERIYSLNNTPNMGPAIHERFMELNQLFSDTNF